MEGSSQTHGVRPLRLKTRSITSTEIYTLAPNWFKDFWRDRAQLVPAMVVERV